MNSTDQFLNQLVIDLEDVCDDIQFDHGTNTVAEAKIRDLIKQIEDYTNGDVQG